MSVLSRAAIPVLLVSSILSGCATTQDGDEDSDGVFDRRDRCADTPANTPVRHNGCPLPQYPVSDPAPPPVSDVTTLNDEGNVMFAVNSEELTGAATSKLAVLIDKLNDPSVKAIKVIGFTDSQGSEAYNQNLSERRAGNVADFLVTQGLSPEKVTSQGRGESEPVADNSTAEGRAKNRRVELHLN